MLHTQPKEAISPKQIHGPELGSARAMKVLQQKFTLIISKELASSCKTNSQYLWINISHVWHVSGAHTVQVNNKKGKKTLSLGFN